MSDHHILNYSGQGASGDPALILCWPRGETALDKGTVITVIENTQIRSLPAEQLSPVDCPE